MEDGGVDDGLDRANGARGEPHEGDGGDGDGDVHLLVLERRFRRYRRPGSEERRREIVLASRLGHPGHVTAEPGGEGRLNDLLVRVLHLLELLGLGLVEQLLAVDHLGELVPRCALLDPEHLVRVLGHARRRRRRRSCASRGHRRGEGWGARRFRCPWERPAVDGRGGMGGVRSVRPRGSVSGEGSGRSSYPNAGRPLDATRCAAVGAACTAACALIPRA